MIDLQYFEDLVFFLKKDESLRKFFVDRDFFAMPKVDPDKKPCDRPFEKGLWIYPGETVRNTNDRARNCAYKGIHTFYISIMVSCNRDQFVTKKKDGDLVLDGPVIELMKTRKAVKDAVKRFATLVEKSVPPKNYNYINWQKDEMIHYMDDDGCTMLNATTEFNLEVL